MKRYNFLFFILFSLLISVNLYITFTTHNYLKKNDQLIAEIQNDFLHLKEDIAFISKINPEIIKILSINSTELNSRIKSFVYDSINRVDETLTIIDNSPRVINNKLDEISAKMILLEKKLDK